MGREVYDGKGNYISDPEGEEHEEIMDRLEKLEREYADLLKVIRAFMPEGSVLYMPKKVERGKMRVER